MPALGSQLLLAALFVSVGFVGGALVCLWWFEHQKQTLETERKTAAKKPADEGKETTREVVRLLRDRLDGKLVIEIGGKTYNNTKTLSPAQRQDLVKLLPEWAAWLRSDGDISTQPTPKLTALEPEEPPKPPVALPATRMVADVVPPAASNPPVSQSVQPSSRPVVTGPLSPRPIVTGPLTPPKTGDLKLQPSKTIVAQINDVLQEKLPGTPLEGKGIRLAEDIHHCVVVWIGLEHYSGIDVVPDPDIQAAIRSAVTEWEQQTERNLGS